MLSRDEIVTRAKSKLGEDKYNVVFNNCEHFAHWCCTGTSWSNQTVGGLLFGNLANDGGAKKLKLS